MINEMYGEYFVGGTKVDFTDSNNYNLQPTYNFFTDHWQLTLEYQFKKDGISSNPLAYVVTPKWTFWSNGLFDFELTVHNAEQQMKTCSAILYIDYDILDAVDDNVGVYEYASQGASSSPYGGMWMFPENEFDGHAVDPTDKVVTAATESRRAPAGYKFLMFDTAPYTLTYGYDVYNLILLKPNTSPPCDETFTFERVDGNTQIQTFNGREMNPGHDNWLGTDQRLVWSFTREYTDDTDPLYSWINLGAFQSTEPEIQ